MDNKTCYACAYSYMEPDSPFLICGHPEEGVFGTYLRKQPLEDCGWERFEQHPRRTEKGELKSANSI
jgi:hypothetical protein